MYSDKWRLFQDLKDRNDELTAEIESVKHLLPNIKGKAGTPCDWPLSKIPIKDGSFLSDYIKTKRGSARSSVSGIKNNMYDIVLYECLLYQYICTYISSVIYYNIKNKKGIT